MRAWLGFLLLVITLPFGPAQADPIPDHVLVDPAYEVPDLSAASGALLTRFQALAAERAARAEAEPSGDLDAALTGLFLPRDARDFAARYSVELAVAKDPADPDPWRGFAEAAYKRGDFTDAAAAADKVYRLSASKAVKADMLALRGEIAAQLGDGIDAINLTARSLTLADNRDRQRRLARLIEQFDLTIRDVELNVERRLPSACLVFSQRLKDPQALEPQDYIRIEGGADLDVSLGGFQICLTGVEHGKSYSVTVKKGLEAENGSRTYKDYERSFTVPNRGKAVSFSAGAYVLARSDRRTIPVKTVNTDSVELKLYRVDDRNLTTVMEEGLLLDNLDQWRAQNLEDRIGALVWEGTLETENPVNAETTTALPLKSILTARAPGIYALTGAPADDDPDNRYRAKATQWVLISDIGLISFQGDDGLTVMARSLETAEPRRYVRLTLVSRNNKVLGRARTDTRGIAHFAPGLLRGKGGDAPQFVTALGGQADYNFLRLSGPELDLSERGVAGRPAPGAADAFLYAERGVYRPGETVHLSTLLRDGAAHAMGGVPLTLKLFRPNGAELKSVRQTGDARGGYQFELPLSAAAQPGRWRASAYLDPEGASVGETSFQVEDFVPQRIGLTIEADSGTLVPGKPVVIEAKGTFFYGPPAADLNTEAELYFETDPAPFEGYDGYSFGLVQAPYHGGYQDLPDERTDADGVRRLMLDDLDWPETTQLVRAVLGFAMLDVNGRPVPGGVALKLRPRAVEVGVRAGSDASFADGEEADFDLVALDRDGDPVAGRTLRYRLVREHYSYNWYGSGGHWSVQSTSYDEAVEGGEIALDEQGHGTLARKLEPGRYRIDVYDTAGQSAASTRFTMGWRAAPTPPNVPDALELTVENDDLEAGGTLNAFAKAPFAGKALIAVMREGLLHSEMIDLPAEGADFELEVEEDWGPGAYVMVTAFRPDLATPSMLPARAMGLHWFSIDRARRDAAIHFDVPDLARPNSRVTIPLSVEGGAGEEMTVTLAAVDEGILQITRFETPDAAGHYLGQRQLGVGLRDLYGHLIPPTDAAPGALRSGGDRAYAYEVADVANTREDTLAQRSVRTVALFLGTATIGKDGTGEASIDLPDFNGRLRLMAVGYGATGLGGGEADLVVRDDVATDLLLPRFLAPGDVARVPLSVHNLTGAAGRFSIDLDVTGAVARQGEGPIALDLAKDERGEVTLVLTGTGVGTAHFDLTVSAEGIDPVTRSFDMAVRPAQPNVTTRTVETLEPGGRAEIAPDVLAGVYPGRARADITLAARPDFDVAAMLEALDRYPYGCTEQSVSVALPLLVYAPLAAQAGLEADPLDLRRRIDAAIGRILNRQNGQGGFGAWSAWSLGPDWLTAYVYDFFTRALQAGYDVPRAAYAHAEDRLKAIVDRAGRGEPEAEAYALYALARTGVMQGSDVRYFAETRKSAMRTRLALGHLAAALASVGETARAEDLFAQAIGKSRPKGVAIHDYGSDLRDSAALVALIAEAFPGSSRALSLAEQVEMRLGQTSYFSTQERAWLALGAYKLSRGAGADLVATLDGAPVEAAKGVARTHRTAEGITAPLVIENKGEGPIRVVQTISGHPVETLPPAANGFRLTRQFYALDGSVPDLGAVKHNDRLVVVITAKSLNDLRDQQVLIADRLPAGFEIENPNLQGSDMVKQVPGLPDLSSPDYSAARDDRFVAAFNLFGREREIAVAYTVRAVTPGTFVLPGAYIEDMYRPHLHARGAVGELVITP